MAFPRDIRHGQTPWTAGSAKGAVPGPSAPAAAGTRIALDINDNIRIIGADTVHR